MQIREERPEDQDQVAAIHREAFGPHGSVVAELLTDLRKSLSKEPGLSLVALEGDRVQGHVLFTRNLLDAPKRLVDVQVLSPVAVRPDRQRQGIGSQLIRHGLDLLDRQQVPLVFLEGPPDYYGRLGFGAGTSHGFRRPSLRIPEPAFQVQVLSTHEAWMTGSLIYRHEFWDHDCVGLRDGE